MLHELLVLQRPLISVDLETTSTHPETARIVEIGLVILRPDGSTKEWKSFINPGEAIPAEATRVHHITEEMVRDAPTFAQVAPNLRHGFAEADFVCYNGTRFDLPVLRAEFARAAVPWDYDQALVIDPLRLWHHLQPRRLEDAIRTYGEAHEHEIEGGAHNALGDAKGSLIALRGMLRASTLPRDVARLHALCAPNHVDPDGKLVWRNGEACIGFGKHKGVALAQVPRGYLQWMIKRDFPAATKRILADALNGVYPVKEGGEEVE